MTRGGNTTAHGEPHSCSCLSRPPCRYLTLGVHRWAMVFFCGLVVEVLSWCPCLPGAPAAGGLHTCAGTPHSSHADCRFCSTKTFHARTLTFFSYFTTNASPAAAEAGEQLQFTLWIGLVHVDGSEMPAGLPCLKLLLLSDGLSLHAFYLTHCAVHYTYLTYHTIMVFFFLQTCIHGDIVSPPTMGA